MPTGPAAQRELRPAIAGRSRSRRRPPNGFRQHRIQEAGGLADRRATVAGLRPRDAQVLAGAGDAHVEQAALLVDLVCSRGEHERQAALLAPSNATASHSMPLAECRLVSVTPSTVGACCNAARRASSSVKSTRDRASPLCSPFELPGRRSKSSAKPTRAVTASHFSRAAPPPGGASGRHPTASSAATTVARRPADSSAVRVAARSATHRPAYLGPVEEALGTLHHGRHAGTRPALPRTPATGRWYGTARRSRAPAPRRDQLAQPGGHARGLGRLVWIRPKHRIWPGRALGLLTSPPSGRVTLCLFYDLVRAAYHLRRRPVVTDEPDQGRVAMPRRDAGEEVGAGAGEGVDGLAGSPTTVRSSRSPTHRSSSRCWTGFTSWYSSTTRWRYGPCTVGSDHVLLRQQAGGPQQDVLEVDPAGGPLGGS